MLVNVFLILILYAEILGEFIGDMMIAVEPAMAAMAVCRALRTVVEALCVVRLVADKGRSPPLIPKKT